MDQMNQEFRQVSDMEILDGDLLYYGGEAVFVMEVERWEETDRALSVTIRFPDGELMTVHPGQLYELVR